MSESQAPPAYQVKFTSDASKDVAGLDGSIKKRLKKVLETKIPTDPEAYGTPLRGPLAGYWKHEFASHRIIYRIYQNNPKLVVVCAVGARRGEHAADVYKQLEATARTGRLAEKIAAVLKRSR